MPLESHNLDTASAAMSAARSAASAASSAGAASIVMGAIENFWWTVGGVVVAAAITGLGWFVFTSTQDIATLKAQQSGMASNISDVKNDLKDIKTWLGVPKHSKQ